MAAATKIASAMACAVPLAQFASMVTAVRSSGRAGKPAVTRAHAATLVSAVRKHPSAVPGVAMIVPGALTRCAARWRTSAATPAAARGVSARSMGVALPGAHVMATAALPTRCARRRDAWPLFARAGMFAASRARCVPAERVAQRNTRAVRRAAHPMPYAWTPAVVPRTARAPDCAAHWVSAAPVTPAAPATAPAGPRVARRETAA